MGAVVFDILQEHICRKMPKRYPLRQVRIVLACLLARRMLLCGIALKKFPENAYGFREIVLYYKGAE